MRRILAGIAALCIASVALADGVWTRPGWYVVAETMFGDVLDKGPYDDSAACEKDLPPSDADADYHCEYFEKQPPEGDL